MRFEFGGQTVLVTGASGFIGGHVCQALIAADARVVGVSRAPRATPSEAIDWQQCDLSDQTAVDALFARCRPDVVLHLASYVSGARELEAVAPMVQHNLLTSVYILTAATRAGCRRVVLAGSLEEPEPVAGLTPSSPYAAAKWASSAYARMFHALYQTPAVVARLFMVYGPGQQDLRKLVPYVTLACLRGEIPQLSSGARPVDWIYVDDVVTGLLTIAQAPGVEGESIDIGSGTLVTVRDVVEQLVHITGAAVAPQFGALGERPLERICVANVAATQARLGWQSTVSLEAGLRRTVAWYASQLQQNLV